MTVATLTAKESIATRIRPETPMFATEVVIGAANPSWVPPPEGVEERQRWLQGVVLSPPSSAPPFNWLGWGEAATLRATTERASRSERLAWGRIGTTVYGWLAANNVDPENCELKAMLLRANLIADLGEGRGILNPEPILTWFKSMLPGSLDEIRGRVKDPRSTATLRKLKKRSYVLSLISNRVSLVPEMRAWLALSRDLP